MALGLPEDLQCGSGGNDLAGEHMRRKERVLVDKARVQTKSSRPVASETTWSAGKYRVAIDLEASCFMVRSIANRSPVGLLFRPAAVVVACTAQAR
jgi:hypothetical protein